MFTKQNRVIALDVGASRIVLAEFDVGKGSAPVLRKYGVSPVEGEGSSESDRLAFIVTSIREKMRELGIKPAPMLMSVSGQAVFPRFVKLPPVGKDKLSQIIQYEAEQNVPFPIDEVVWDYHLIGHDADERNVMLVAAKIENIKRLTDCVQAAELEPDVVDVSPMALYNAVRYNAEADAGCQMVLDIGARSSSLIFIERDRIFSRSIPVAGNTITQELMKAFELSFADAEALKKEHGFVAFGGVTSGSDDEVAEQASKIIRSVLTRLHAEVNRSINFYRSQQAGSAPERVLLTGGSSMLAHVDTFFQDKLRVPVEYFNPFAGVEVDGAVDVDQLNADIQNMGEVVGLAIRAGGLGIVDINLMPPDLVARKVFRRRVPFFAISAVGVFLTLLCWWGYYSRAGAELAERSEKMRDAVEQLTRVQRQLEAAMEEREASQARLSRLYEQVDLRTRWLEILETLGGALQEGMWITGINPVQERGQLVGIEVTVQGFADLLEDTEEGTAAERLRDRLRAATVFSDDSEIAREMAIGSYRREVVLRIRLEDDLPVR